MGFSVSAIKADCHALKSCGHNLVSHFFIDERSIGCQRSRQAAALSMCRETEDIFAIQGFASTEHKDWFGTFGKRVDESHSLLGGHVLPGQFGSHVDPAAVHALQVA